jgi:putative ABC transport system ATP-binding protein
MALLEVRNAGKVYGTQSSPVTALADVSLSVAAGEFVALVGRSGCGKSTLLNLCGAMDFPTSGEVSIDGHTLTALANVELPLLIARRADARRVAEERLGWVEMAGYGDRFPHQLSGGQQQRIAIARALAQDPRLVLADEPTGNLDTATANTILRLLRRIVDELAVSVLLATHSREGLAVADRVISLRDGKIE